MTETLFRHEQLMHAHDGDIRHSLAREKIGIEKEEKEKKKAHGQTFSKERETR